MTLLTNLDIRSASINYELAAVVRDPGVAAKARSDFEGDLKDAGPIRWEAWRGRPFVQGLKERFSYWLLAHADFAVARLELLRKMG